MEDFASALVVSMLRQAMAEQGIGLPPLDGPPLRNISMAEKRGLLNMALERAGPVGLLRVADIVPGFVGHPVARLFAGARNGGETIERWLRMERYFHSRHRSRLRSAGPKHVELEHFDTKGEQPTMGEDLMVAGLVLGLLRWTGARQVRLRFAGSDGTGGSDGWLACDGADFAAPGNAGFRSHRWRLDWRDFQPAHARAPRQQPAKRRTADGRAIEHPLVARLFEDILADPASSRTLAERARTLGMSSRTLQRRLNEAGWSLRRITAAARTDAAAQLLSETELPIALIGLLAGYSDQPHFQREFVKGLGPTPGAYRRLSAGT